MQTASPRMHLYTLLSWNWNVKYYYYHSAGCYSLQESCDTFQEMAERRVCMQVRGDEETELEFDDEFVAGSDLQHFRRQVNTPAQKVPQPQHKVCNLKSVYKYKHRCFSVWNLTLFSFPAYIWSQRERSAVLCHECRAAHCTVGVAPGKLYPPACLLPAVRCYM